MKFVTDGNKEYIYIYTYVYIPVFNCKNYLSQIMIKIIRR